MVGRSLCVGKQRKKCVYRLNMKKIICLFAVLAAFLSVCVCASDNATRMQCINSIISYCDVELEDADESVLEEFSDVPEFSSQQQKQYVCVAIQNGIVKGYEDKTLRLDDSVTRGEFACMLYRARDLCKSVTSDKITYNGSYGDLSDWNKNEVHYCIQSGFMMGYGDKFGTNDSITLEQLGIVTNRMRFGLTTREKYLLLDVCGICPIPMTDILNSSYDKQLKDAKLPSRQGENVYAVNSAQTAAKLETLMELQGNMNWEKLTDKDYVNRITQPFYDLVYENIKRYTVISDGRSTKTIDDVISDAEQNKVKRESIFVFCPVNNAESSFVNYGRTVGVGYEYYRYVEIDGSTPNGEEVGTWYKRTVEVDLVEYSSVSADKHDLVCKYGTPVEL